MHAGLSESGAAASGKAKAKRTRWGPEHGTSPPPTKGQASLPALGFKGVNSHRPPGQLLQPKPGTSTGSFANKQASEDHGAATQPESFSDRPAPDSVTAEQPVARAHTGRKDDQVAQHSAHVHAGHSRSPEDNSPGLASNRSRHAFSTADNSRLSPGQDKESALARQSMVSSSPGAVHRERVKASSVKDGYPEAQPRGSSRNEGARRELAKHSSVKHTRHSNEHRHHRQPEAEGRLHISPAKSDRLHGQSREHRSGKGHWREISEGRPSHMNEARESDRYYPLYAMQR